LISECKGSAFISIMQELSIQVVGYQKVGIMANRDSFEIGINFN